MYVARQRPRVKTFSPLRPLAAVFLVHIPGGNRRNRIGGERLRRFGLLLYREGIAILADFPSSCLYYTTTFAVVKPLFENF